MHQRMNPHAAIYQLRRASETNNIPESPDIQCAATLLRSGLQQPVERLIERIGKRSFFFIAKGFGATGH
ncbi:MAG: hypothetical protein K0Q50_1778 [Vampirovibrio sp.]|nr:hypothetical protein [Vampirovibrio sp.]